MQVFRTLSNPNRNPAIDVFRGVAIIAVVLYHFNYTVYMGTLGVDLFFVISGFLVGGLLTDSFKAGKQISFIDFFLKRGFKIWPSYFFFLFLGGIIGYLLFHRSSPSLLPDNWWKYVFFYENYNLGANEWIYSHAWSLCIEEHFYILLPIIFILIQRCGNVRSLTFVLFLLVVTGDVSKLLTFTFSASKDTYFTTHNRIDALAWGVLLNVFIRCSDFIKKFPYKILMFIISVAFLIVLIKIYFVSPYFFRKVAFRALVPVVFTVMVGSLYFVDLSFLKPFRIIGYYSYNWYLWHPIVSVLSIKYFGAGIIGLVVYLGSSFFVAILFTSLIEEPFLGWRKKYFQPSVAKVPA